MKTPAIYKPARLTKQGKQKVARLLKQQQITLNDMEGLTKPERDYLGNTYTQILEQLDDAQREHFLAKIDQILSPETKSDIWENNHLAITDAIADNMRVHGFMPTQTEIAYHTGLSRQTVAKHLKEYKTQPEFIQQAQQFTFMAPQLLANVYKLAVEGDVRAARLYFEMIGAKTTPPQNTLPGTQHNYIQINNTILSQENLASLTAEQLNQIEGIIKG
jgi:DNA-binding MarR family transcriptional regulator